MTGRRGFLGKILGLAVLPVVVEKLVPEKDDSFIPIDWSDCGKSRFIAGVDPYKHDDIECVGSIYEIKTYEGQDYIVWKAHFDKAVRYRSDIAKEFFNI
jgi:hypothetical protein